MLDSKRYLKIITIIIIRDSRGRGGEVIGTAVKIIVVVVVVLQTVELIQYWVADQGLSASRALSQGSRLSDEGGCWSSAPKRWPTSKASERPNMG